MSRPQNLVFRTTHPRVLFTSVDISTLVTRSNTVGTQSVPGWKDWWDSKALPQASSLESGKTVAQIATENSSDQKMLLLAVTGIVDDISANRQKAIAAAKYNAANLSPVGVTDPGTGKAREWLSALAWVYDILHDFMTPDDRKQIGESLIRMCDIMSGSSGGSGTNTIGNRMHGHSQGDQAHQIMGALALVGDSGLNYDFTSGPFDATVRLNEGLDHWYGPNQGDPGAIDYARYYSSDGGDGKGMWYSYISKWYTFLLLRSYANAVLSSDIDGDAYDPWVDETWVERCGEWLLHTALRGDGDYFRSGDTFRGANPWFTIDERQNYAAIIARGGQWRKPVNWLYDQKQARADSLNQSPAYLRTQDFLQFDPTDPENSPVAPINLSPEPPRVRLFDPPGSFWYRDTWDIPRSCIINVDMHEFYYLNHRDLDVGSIQISVNDDMVLLNTGYYDTNPAGAPEDFGGLHNNSWYDQSISKSGIPLIWDPNSTGQEHRTPNENGSLQFYPNGRGGQLYKEFADGRDPDTILEITQDAGGLAWRNTGTDSLGTNKFRIVDDTPDVTFLHADVRRAYLRFHTDFNTSSDRTTRLEHKLLVIKREGLRPILFRAVQVGVRDPSYLVTDQWHFWGEPAVSLGKIDAPGFRSSQGQGIGGKLRISYLFPGPGYTARKVGNNAVGSYGAQQFGYIVTGSTFQNFNPLDYPPSTPNGGRNLPDLGRWRQEVALGQGVSEHSLVCAIFPLDLGTQAPEHTIFEDSTHWGIRFDATPKRTVYKIAKNEVGFVGPQDEVDTTPPSIPAGLASQSGVTSGRVTLTWNVNPEPDMDAYKIFKRIKV